MYKDLNNKRILIIGGSGLIGSEIVNKFRESNSYIFNFDINNNHTKINYSKYEFIKFDIAANLNLASNFSKKLKIIKPEIVINCSYPISNGWSKCNFDDINLKYLQGNINAHLVSYLWSSILVLRYLKKSKSKSNLILFGSTYGLRGQDLRIYKGTKMRENAIYSAIKGGIINFTRQAASYYGSNNIRVNCVCPGGLYGHIKGSKSSQSNKFLKQYSDRTPLKRLGYASEIADGVMFLSSEKSSYITGNIFEIDGGWTSI